MKTIKLQIDETGRNSLKDEPNFFNSIIEYHRTIEEIKQSLVGRYGHIPAGKKKVYRTIAGKDTIIGFLHSFWNRDISHMSAKWYQTDWITISEVNETPILIN